MVDQSQWLNENTDSAPYKNSKYQESNFKRNKNFNKGKENAISEIKKGFWSKCFYAEVELIVKVVQ